jgi:hypothetical protein
MVLSTLAQAGTAFALVEGNLRLNEENMLLAPAFRPGEGTDDDVYTITARDAGDITGGLNAAEAVLGRSDLQDVFVQFFDETFNTGRLQRAQRPPSVSNRENEPPLPPKAGGEFGQAAVYQGRGVPGTNDEPKK